MLIVSLKKFGCILGLSRTSKIYRGISWYCHYCTVLQETASLWSMSYKQNLCQLQRHCCQKLHHRLDHIWIRNSHNYRDHCCWHHQHRQPLLPIISTGFLNSIPWGQPNFIHNSNLKYDVPGERSIRGSTF